MKSPRYVFNNDKNRESFQRWSDHRVDQLTASNALMFALASAALGYALTLISDDKTPVAKLSTWPYLLLVFAFLISFISGIWFVFNRLKSFRDTCEIIKLRDKANDPETLERLRLQNDGTDSFTWLLFRVQTISFLLGGLFFFVFVINSNVDRVKVILTYLF